MSEGTPPVAESNQWDDLARAAADRGDESAVSDEVRQLLSFDVDGTP